MFRKLSADPLTWMAVRQFPHLSPLMARGGWMMGEPSVGSPSCPQADHPSRAFHRPATSLVSCSAPGNGDETKEVSDSLGGWHINLPPSNGSYQILFSHKKYEENRTVYCHYIPGNSLHLDSTSLEHRFENPERECSQRNGRSVQTRHQQGDQTIMSQNKISLLAVSGLLVDRPSGPPFCQVQSMHEDG